MTKVKQIIPLNVKSFWHQRISRREAVKRIVAMVFGIGFFGFLLRGVFAQFSVLRDVNISSGNVLEWALFNRSNGVSTFGNIGDIVLGGPIEHSMYSKVAGKMNVGKFGNEVGDVILIGELARGRHTFNYGDATSRSSDAYLKGPGGTQMTSVLGISVARAGSITAHSTTVNITTATTGDVTFEVRINDVNQSDLENEFTSAGGTGIKFKSNTIARGEVPFSINSEIQFFANETGTMVWQDVLGYVEMVFDT